MIDLDAARAEFQAARDAYIEHPDDPVLRREYLDVEKRFSEGQWLPDRLHFHQELPYCRTVVQAMLPRGLPA